MRPKNKILLKNGLLLSTFLVSQLHTIFAGTPLKVDWFLLVDRTIWMDITIMYYGIAVDFLIMAYCLHFPVGVDRRVSKFILIITFLDLLHLITVAKHDFGVSKIGIAILIYIISSVNYNIFKNGED